MIPSLLPIVLSLMPALPPNASAVTVAAQVTGAERFLRDHPQTPMRAHAYYFIAGRQRAVFELESSPDARIRAARKYQTFLERTRAAGEPFSALAEALDRAPFVHRDAGLHPRSVLPAG
jgi:hypothetical protein